MRSLFVLGMFALLGMNVVACGGTGDASRLSPADAPRARTILGDGDADNPKDSDGDGYADNDYDNDSHTPESYEYHDKDDKAILDYGRPANAALRDMVTSLIERYYAAAAAGDAHTACALLPRGLADSLAEDYGGGSGPSYLRGAKDCEAVLSSLFKRQHGRLASPIEVTGVRLRGNQAEVLLGSHRIPASDIYLERERGQWKVEDLFSNTLP